MPADLFADTGLRPAAKPLTVFRAELMIGFQLRSFLLED